MDPKQAHKRLFAAKALLLEPTTTREKFSAVRNLIEGINPGLDKALLQVDEAISTVEKVIDGRVIQISAEHLPENTEEEKKRKRALLLFLNTWNKLKSEVSRVAAELEHSEQAQTPAEHVSVWGRIFNIAKSPFGIITIVAVGIVVAMQTTSVEVVIQNQGCGTLQPFASIPFSLPGLSLPKDPIPNGGTATATLPPLPVNTDGTAQGMVTMRALTLTMTIQLPSNIRDVTLNGTSLLGKESKVYLSERQEHVLVLACK